MMICSLGHDRSDSIRSRVFAHITRQPSPALHSIPPFLPSSFPGLPLPSFLSLAVSPSPARARIIQLTRISSICRALCVLRKASRTFTFAPPTARQSRQRRPLPLICN